MAKRKNGSAALAVNDFPAELATESKVPPIQEMAHSTTGTYNAMEATFFDRGDRGIVEPPIYLPREPMLLPIVGILFLAGLTALVLV